MKIDPSLKIGNFVCVFRMIWLPWDFLGGFVLPYLNQNMHLIKIRLYILIPVQ